MGPQREGVVGQDVVHEQRQAPQVVLLVVRADGEDRAGPDPILEALLDPALRTRMKQRGYEQSQRFSWSASVARILEIYREVAANPVTQKIAAD